MGSKLQSESAGGSCWAFVAGATVVIIGGGSDLVRALLAEPVIVLFGLAVASGIGSGLARNVVKAPLLESIGIALAYGALVPMLTAAFIAWPIAPIAAMFAVVAWPATIPAALAWLVLVRWDGRRERVIPIPPARAAAVLMIALLVLRFTQPAATVSAAAGRCLTFPGESIATISWSPDGEWLGVGSERVGEAIVRIIGQESGEITELARGPNIDVAWPGVAVGPGGATTYVVNDLDAADENEGATFWLASPTMTPRPFAILASPDLFGLTWTPDGIAAVQWGPSATGTETYRPVWVRPNAGHADTLETIAPARLLGLPVLAPMLDPLYEAPLRVRTPSGDRTLEWPSDASSEVSVTTDGAFLVFHARALTADDVEEAYSQVVAQSTETGQRVVLLEGAAWSPKVAAGRLAYLTFPSDPENSVCVKPVTQLGS